MSQAPSSAYERLLAAAAQLKVPDAVREAALATPEDPQPGQIWRVAWVDVVELVAITSVSDTAVHAVPVSLETHFHDEKTLLLPAAATTVEQPLALWYGLGARLPWWVLDRQVSQLPDSLKSPQDGPPGSRRGSAIASPAAPAAEFRAALADALEHFAAASWTPAGSGDLTTLLRKHKLGAHDLVRHLDIEPPRALALLRGQTPLTPDEAAILGPVMGQTQDRVLEANPELPDQLVHQLSRPARRAQIRLLAHRSGTSEQQARLSAAYGAFGLAARQDGGTTDWSGRLDRFFHVHLDQAPGR
ncbi:hypothetical protein J7I98_22065 [Streptomyces sp. ISL-98]|uniref:hypothetical protein n=1 Tax=Streptomyces sp. ISL-98 TaxID=2819192 RepID=UPI001BE681A5|nr:hypothetical protein [Streptomyces sp. ISL-98]MBT2508524.1 hypothetical protein [Streptomyces sp. ISL-98]